ncbi:MAG: hypothetical protein VKK98_00525 [Cyanobacteriota bacterium]|nr:hypothetical protein [Cyanobacteriota bacterium]
MAWDPNVLRKYNTTGHFRLLNQLRGELRDNPLLRPKQGETVGEANRSRSLRRLLEGRPGASGRGRRSQSASTGQETRPATEPSSELAATDQEGAAAMLND